MAIREAMNRVKGRVALLPDEPQASRSSVISTLDHQRPQILHISCHGDEEGLILQDEYKNPVAVSSSWLIARVQATPTVRLVLLSACVSAGHAQAIAAACNVDAIGFRGHIAASDARTFFKLFYSLLARSHSVSSAFTAAASVSEAIAVESVWAGSGAYRLPRPWKAWSALGGTLGLAVGAFALIDMLDADVDPRGQASTVEETSTADEGETPSTAVPTGPATSTTTEPGESGSSQPPAPTTEAATTTKDSETSVGPPPTPPPRPRPRVSRSAWETQLRKALDGACRPVYPDDSSGLVMTNDDGVLHTRVMFEAPCPAESLCGCSKRVLERQRIDNLAFEFTSAVVHYNAVPAPEGRLNITWKRGENQ